MSSSRKSPPRVLAAATSGWRLLDQDGKATDLDDASIADLPMVIDTFAVPAIGLISMPLWVQSTDYEVVGDAVRMQLECRRLIRDGDPPNLCTWRILLEEPKRTLVGVMLLRELGLETLGLSKLTARHYVPGAYCRKLPKKCAAIWYERQQPVVALQGSTELIHFQALVQGDTHSLIFQLSCLIEQLIAEKVLEEPPHCWLIDAQCPGATSLSAAIEVKFDRKPTIAEIELQSPVATKDRGQNGEWLPSSEALRRSSRKRHRIRQRAFAAVSIAYLVIIVAMGGKLWRLDRNVNGQDRRLAELRGPVAKVAAQQTVWNGLAGATDTSHYPLEVLARCVDQLQPSGVELTRFELTEDGTLKIAGTAGSVAEVLVFKEAITRAQALEHYAWNFPPPRNEPEGGGATFQASATLSRSIVAQPASGRSDVHTIP